MGIGRDGCGGSGEPPSDRHRCSLQIGRVPRSPELGRQLPKQQSGELRSVHGDRPCFTAGKYRPVTVLLWLHDKKYCARFECDLTHRIKGSMRIGFSNSTEALWPGCLTRTIINSVLIDHAVSQYVGIKCADTHVETPSLESIFHQVVYVMRAVPDRQLLS